MEKKRNKRAVVQRHLSAAARPPWCTQKKEGSLGSPLRTRWSVGVCCARVARPPIAKKSALWATEPAHNEIGRLTKQRAQKAVALFSRFFRVGFRVVPCIFFLSFF
ncbi:hypothetical protein TW95_gp0984 [Pandoravirus inopinatum]|uniref:Transmembrane protein n=1 Tax=Pandoravirus inopinatum TaxID=1605721 RepID=A0A0B5IY29_9VIRU|nr:hypothetical protein TW95_gp0984 [Pandoravirus inopinatum]AJF97718.1 hypothetical protein [Pandoravirus inopinatum]